MNRRRPIALALAAALALFGLGPANGRVQAMPYPEQLALAWKLPDLAVVAPFDFRIEYSSTGRRLLRFSTVIVNLGSGPFRLSGYDTDGEAAVGDLLRVRQQILQSDGTWRIRNTSATMKWAADGHNHWHVLDAQRFELQTLEGNTVLRAAKTGFCFLDSYPYGSTKPGHYGNDLSVCQVAAATSTVPMGVSVRWGDIYKSTIAFQWIDITGLASGDYLLRITVDPPSETGGRFLESNESNNRGWATIHISRSSVTVLSKSAKP